MNPWAVIILLLAAGLLIVSVKGTQDNLIAALKGKSYGNSTIAEPLPNTANGIEKLYGTMAAPSASGVSGGYLV
jgi:hypothetical protein